MWLCTKQVSYNVLSKVSPITHSVMNCLKRIAVIVASVIVFQNPIRCEKSEFMLCCKPAL